MIAITINISIIFVTVPPHRVANHLAVLFPYPALCDLWCLLAFYNHYRVYITGFWHYFALFFHWFTDFLRFFALLIHWFTKFLHLIFLFVALSDASCGYVGRVFRRGDGQSLEDQLRGVMPSPRHGGRFSCSEPPRISSRSSERPRCSSRSSSSCLLYTSPSPRD